MFHYKFFNFYKLNYLKSLLNQNNFYSETLKNSISNNFFIFFFSDNLRYAVNISSLYDIEYKRKSHHYHIITSYRAAYHEITNYYLPYHMHEVFFYAFKNIDYF